MKKNAPKKVICPVNPNVSPATRVAGEKHESPDSYISLDYVDQGGD